MSDYIDVNVIGKREGQRIESVPTVTITKKEFIKTCTDVMAQSEGVKRLIDVNPVMALAFIMFSAEVADKFFIEKEDE